MKIVSFFSGAGGLDLGFQRAGFDIIWANEYDREIWETYETNHPTTILERKSITDIVPTEVPDCDGIIGGPPCQSWSEAGTLRGFNDKRGKLFFDFIEILNTKQPKFFLAENVSGLTSVRHADALENIVQLFNEAGYNLQYKLLDANNYNVPQTRKRIIFVGYRNDLGINFTFPEPQALKPTLRDAIYDLSENALPALAKNHSNDNQCVLPNHEYMIGDFSSMFMSRNRVRTWDQPSFTIQAGGRHAPIHPQAPLMEKVDVDKFTFVGNKNNYRRLSVRECARIQTFPDNFIFKYKYLSAAYKMIGNAVPVNFAQILADQIRKDLLQIHNRVERLQTVETNN